MLDTEHQTNEGRLWEDPGRTQEESELEDISEKTLLLARAAEVGAEAARACRESGWKGDWLLLLQALCSLTARHAAQGDPAPFFTAERLRQEIAAIVGPPDALWWSEDSDNTRKKFTNAWKALENDLPCIEPNLRVRAINSRVAGLIALSPPGRLGTTNAMGYGLTVTPLKLPEDTPAEVEALPSLPSQSQTTAPEISYLEEMEIYPIPGLKRPLSISLPGMRAALLVTPLVIALVLGGFLSWFVLALWLSDASPRVLFQGTIVTAAAAGLVAWICYPFYTLINDRIVRAPSLLEATLPLGHVLVLRREGDSRVLRMVRYTARCPICDGEVTIEKGRRQHRGRLVGECGRNPVEHSFSFDFITGKGRQL